MRRRAIRCVLAATAAVAVAVSVNRSDSLRAQSADKSVKNVPPPVARHATLPLSFEVNRGQSDARVKFLSRGQGYALFLTETGATLSLRGESRGAAVTMALEGARKHPRITGVDGLQGRVNYFRGNDRSNWRTNISTFERVRYEEIYRGIDLVYYGTDARPGTTGRVTTELEYDFIVAPGADPSRIRLAFAGAEKVAIDDNGDLVLTTAAGELRHRKPVIYQMIDGKRREIAGGYRLSNPESQTPNPGSARVSFSISSYDASLPLVIDPTLAYSTYLGGSGGGSALDRGTGIAVDATGAAYVTGFTYSTNFPTTPGAIDSVSSGNSHAFVTKLNPTGSALVYSTYIGTDAQNTLANAIAVDSTGSAYITGNTGNGFPTTAGAFDTTHDGADHTDDPFVTKFAPDGASLVYSTYLGGALSTETGFGIAVDSTGAAYVTGRTFSTDFPMMNAADPTHNGNLDVFVTKLNPAGSQLVYSTYLGGSSADSGRAIAVNPTSGEAYITGVTDSSDFPALNAFDSTHSGSEAFVTKLTSAGTLAYSTFLGGTSHELGHGIAVDSTGSAYVTGYSRSTDFTTSLAPGFDQVNDGNYDVFVVKFAPDGASLLYWTFLGGLLNDFGYAIAIDASGAAFVTGQTSSAGFPTTVDALDSSFNGIDSDAFFTKIAPTGTTLEYSTFLGASTDSSVVSDAGYAIAVDGSGAAYLTGQTGGQDSNDFPLTAGVWDSTFTGNTEAFITKFSFGGGGGPVTLTLSPSYIFPADRRYKRVTISATDSLGAPLACTIQGVTQNTPQQSTQIDYVIINATTVDLRAERPIGGVTRKYTINVTCGGTPAQAVVEVTGVR